MESGKKLAILGRDKYITSLQQGQASSEGDELYTHS